jgi:hypothetical protein
MVAGGWLDVAWRALEHRPRPDHTEQETKEFIYTRETWQFLQETLPAPEDAGRTEGVLRARPRRERASDDASPSHATEAAHDRVATEAGEREATEEDFPRGETEWHGRMVRLRGLKARPDLNGSLAFAQGPGGSADRVAVLANPLGVASSSSATTDGNEGEKSPEVLSVRHACLSVFESPGLGLGDVACGAPDGAASVAAGASAEKDARDFSSSENAEEKDSAANARDEYSSILGALAEADARRAEGDWDGAIAA